MNRVVEIVLCILFLILVSPIMLVVAVLIYFNMGRPIFFTQQRAGFHSKPFKIYKFRIMHVSEKSDLENLGDDSRLTKLGAWLRRLSLDELPQLFNILEGKVSFVGPRPLIMDYLKIYTPEQLRRHEVKPGMTGWAQVNGRNSLSWEDKLKLDIWYVDNRSFWLDLKILYQTIFVVIGGEGIEYQEHTTGIK